MNDKNPGLGRILVKWLQGMLEILAFFPIIFTIGILLIPQEIWIWIASLVFLYLIGLVLGKYLLGRPRYAHFVSELLITSVVAWLATDNTYTIVLIFLFGFILLDRGIRFRGMPWIHMFPTSALWIGLIIYLLGGAIYSFVPVLQPYFPYLAWMGLGYTIITLFTVNSEQLKSASLPGEDKAPVISSTILKNNRVLVLLTIALVAIISYFNRLREGVTRLVTGLFRLIVDIIIYLANLMYQPTTGSEQPSGQGPMDMLPQETGEPSWILKALEVVAMVVAGIVILILLWYGFKALYKLGKKCYKYLMGILKDRISLQEDAGYIDEKESLMGFADIGKDYVDRFQNWMKKLMEKEPKWEELVDNHQRIRFLYRNLLLKCMKAGYTYKNYLTPKETGRDIKNWNRKEDSKIEDLILTYDRIRYGQDNVEDEKVQKLADTLLKKK